MARSSLRRIGFLGVLLLGGVLGLVTWRQSVRTGVVVPEAHQAFPQPETLEPAALVREAELPPASTHEPDDTASERRALEEEPDALAEVLGRLVDAAGSPVAGADLRWGRSDAPLLSGPIFEHTASTGDDGRFSIRFSPHPRPYVLAIDARGFLERHWIWIGPEPGGVKDLGDVVMARAGSVRVRILDGAGAPVTTQVEVRAVMGTSEEVYRTRAGWRPVERSDSEPASDGSFLLEELPSGLVLVSADVAGRTLASTPVEIRAGATVETTLLYGGSDPDELVRLRLQMGPGWAGFPDPPPRLRLSGGGVERRSSLDPDGRPRFLEVPPGTYRVEIDDERFRAWSLDGVRPGAEVEVELEGSASIELHVFRHSEELTADDYQATLRPRGEQPVDEIPLRPSAAAEYVYAGIVPGDWVVAVVGEAGGGRADLIGLAPNETRSVVILLERPGEVRGRVRDADGEPVRAIVNLERRSQDPEDAADALRDAPPAERSDRDGSFRFERVPPGTYLAQARARGRLSPLVGLEVESGATTDVELVVPSPAFLVARAEGLPEDRKTTLDLRRPWNPTPEEADLASRNPFSSLLVQPITKVSVDRDGSIRMGPVEPGGPYELAWEISAPIFWETRPDGSRSGSTPTPLRAVLGSYVLASGDNDVGGIDFSAVRLGSLRVSLTIDEAPLWRFRACVVGNSGYRVARFDQDGEARFEELFPGLYAVRIDGDAWRAAVPELVTVPAGGEASISVPLTLVPGELRFLDAKTGSPISSRPVALIPELTDFTDLHFSWSPYPVAMLTDEDGRLTSRQAPGRYSVAIRPEDSSEPLVRCGELEWTLRGPATREVRVDMTEGRPR